MVYPSGSTYTGAWVNNVREGEGTMVWIQDGVSLWQHIYRRLGQQRARGGGDDGVDTRWCIPLAAHIPAPGSTTCARGRGRWCGYKMVYPSGSTYTGAWVNNVREGE